MKAVSQDQDSRIAEDRESARAGDADAVSSEVQVSERRGEYFGAVVEKEMARRTFLKGASAAGAALVVSTTLPDVAAAHGGGLGGAVLGFETVPPGNEPDVVVPPDYEVDVLLRWGDPLFADAPEFDVDDQTPEAQARQFGFNADLVMWFPLPAWFHARRGIGFWEELWLSFFFPVLKRRQSRRAIIAVNHEYTSGRDMFPGYDGANPTETQVLTEIESHGVTLATFDLKHGRWVFDRSGRFNRRITGTTPMEISGPLRGHEAMKTADDPSGTTVLGCFNNCAGGFTPWGTVLTCEENFDQYFANFDADDPASRFSLRIPAPRGASGRKWERFVPRFDLSSDPNEYNRFGYVVEIDPYDPSEPPRKRTALGRFKHEGAQTVLSRRGHAVAYSGDDARFEYVYKFVSEKKWNPLDRRSNKTLLDEGTLYVARFDVGAAEGDERGDGVWLPLVWEPGNALDAAGFTSQAEILLDTRSAADALGATPMDRPEDIDVSPRTGHVYVALTNNSRRTEPNEANPRVNNQHGHVVEIIEDGGDAAATTFKWNVFIKCGDPEVPAHDARFADIADPVAAGVSPISDPDNLVFDNAGNLWISTDGQYFSGGVGFGQNDGVFAVPVEGPDRGLLRQFLSGVPGGEVCGPEFSGDDRTFFCAIQHPNDGRAFENLWPVDETRVSKPSLIAVRHKWGKVIGS